jgi:uncharacterized membrane protein YcaP (DUF421 family)
LVTVKVKRKYFLRFGSQNPDEYLSFFGIEVGFAKQKMKKIVAGIVAVVVLLISCHAGHPEANAAFQLSPDFHKIFSNTIPVLEIIIRGSIVYLVLFFMLRIILKRESASLGITDLLVVVLLADASQNAMSGGYKSLPDGIILVVTIIFWSHFLNWLGFKSPFFQRIIKPGKLLLVKEGRMIRRNMKKEFLTEEELMSEIRLNGAKQISEVEEAFMETDGRISVITYDRNNDAGKGNSEKKMS